MARISILPIDHNITADDIAIGTDSAPGNSLDTKNFSIGNIAEFIMSYIEDNSSCCGGGSVTLVKYGFLYNWYTVDDSRNIARAGWSVPTDTNFTTLQTYLSGSTTAGGKLKETGLTYWSTLNTGATNEALFNGRGAGERQLGAAPFNNIGVRTYFLSTASGSGWNLYNDRADFVKWAVDPLYGHSIRLIKDTTTLTNGQTGTYTGNDGKIYRTICIGTQEWVADNIAETKYRDRTLIPEVTDNTAWVGLSTGARCSYDNDPSNAL
jgi:uncharacterized protein (TIGR02145 family)